MQCFQADEDMLLSGARVFQGNPPGKLTILLSAPQAEKERTVPHFFCDHASLLFPHTLYVCQELRVVCIGTQGNLMARLSHCQATLWVVQVALLLHHAADAFYPLIDFLKTNIQRRDPQADIIGFTKIWDQVHLLD
jgi:hypothetical protein